MRGEHFFGLPEVKWLSNGFGVLYGNGMIGKGGIQPFQPISEIGPMGGNIGFLDC